MDSSQMQKILSELLKNSELSIGHRGIHAVGLAALIIAAAIGLSILIFGTSFGLR